MRRRLLPFAMAGAIGFLVDAGVLMLATPVAGPYLGRLFSFIAAVLATWGVNRHFAFRDRRGGKSPVRELLQYGLACLGGGLVNLLVYSLLVHYLELATLWLPVAVAVGSLAGMMVNFTLADRHVFTPTHRPGR